MLIKIDAVNIYYEISGQGNIVLLLHGWGVETSSFRPLIDLLQKSYKVIALDFPGFGKSETPRASWDVGNYSTFLSKFMEQIHLKKADVIAHSFGGRVAIKLAVEKPKMINKLILVNSAGIKPRRKFKYYFKTFLAKTGKMASKFLGEPGNNFKKMIYEHIGSKDFQNAGPMRNTFIKIINEDLQPLLKSIIAPTLLIWGENDKETPVYMAKIMEKEIKDSGLVILKNAGHYSYLDQFQQFSTIANNFLQTKIK
jgi:pimeloyl-ACP methyl ester carboxylesterase